ncbi:MAG TPA: SpoIIE family protein phosphatase [Anaerolineae bacterium]|nr:SpoIIE family protein phosphatase [Anaerolineae bacterium]
MRSFRNDSPQLFEAFIKSVQYVVGLKTQQDTRDHLGKFVTTYFPANWTAFVERDSVNGISIRSCTLPDAVAAQLVLTDEVRILIADVLDSGFLASQVIFAPAPSMTVFLPIVEESQPKKVMLVGHETADPLPNELLNIYLAIAGLAGTTFERLNNERELNRHRAHLEELVKERTFELQKTNEQLALEITERKAAQRALHAERERLSVTLASIGDGVIATDTEANVTLLNGVAEELTGWTQEEAEGKRLLKVFNIINEITREPAEDPVDKALKTGVIVGLANHTALIAKDGTERSIADSCAPIRDSSGSIIGAVLVFRDVTEQKKAEEIRVQLHRQAEYELEISNLLLKAADALAESIDLNRVLESLADIVLDVTGRRRIGIYLLDEGTYELEAKAARGEFAIPVGLKFSLKQLAPQFQSAVYDKQSRIIDYEAADVAEGNRQRSKAMNIKVSLVVPLLYKGGVLGVLTLDNPGERQNVTQREIELVEGIAAQAAVAIENARLYEAERNIADTLQEALLTVPESMSGLGYGYMYRSATEGTKVGGDLYDLFELENGRVGITLGDVSGKGLEAATLTSVVRNTIRAYALEGYNPSEIMAKTNDAVRLASGQASFVTVFFAVLDTATGKLTYCSAGHPPAILHRVSGVEILREHSPIIGAFAGMSYTQEETYLQKGDSLVLYTDGITEARCDGGFYGEDRLVDFLAQAQEVPIKEIPQAIYNDVVTYSGGSLSDDIAILAVSLAGGVHA